MTTSINGYTHKELTGKKYFYLAGKKIPKKRVPAEIIEKLIPESSAGSRIKKQQGYYYKEKKIYYLDGKIIAESKIPADVLSTIECFTSKAL